MGLRSMKVLFKVIISLLMITIGTAIFAGSIWDGSVSTARYGYLPQTGMYAASNAFPQNSRVTVTNPDTGKKVDVTILERLEDNNLFLVLSSEAAESIGIDIGDIFYGNISEQDNLISSREEELPYNPDPDVNPSALSEDYSELALIQNYIEEIGGTDETLLVSDASVSIVPEPAVEEEMAEEPESSIETEVVPAPEIVETIPDLVPEAVLPEVVEMVEILEEEDDIPLVDNMPMEEVYISEPKDIVTVPEVVIIPKVEPVKEIDVAEEDIPVLVGMSADVPVLTVSADITGVLPELPVPESDIPVVTSMNTGTAEEVADNITPIQLPELPIIEVEMVEEDIPLAVAMVSVIVPFEDEADINYLLPELVDQPDVDLPDLSLLIADEPEVDPKILLTELDLEIINPEEDISVADDIEMEVEVVLEPSDLRPPVLSDKVEEEEVEQEIIEVAAIVEPEKEIELDSSNYNVTRVLSEDSYYLQIGVYREQYSALDIAGRLGGTYPVTVLVSETANTLNYKVMVGPLGQDESGAVLFSFKSTGYPDAFLRKGL